MARQISRMGDWTTGIRKVRPSRLISSSSSVLVNGHPIGLQHGVEPVIQLPTSVLVGGRPIAYVGKGRRGMATGSPNVFIGDIG